MQMKKAWSYPSFPLYPLFHNWVELAKILEIVRSNQRFMNAQPHFLPGFPHIEARLHNVNAGPCTEARTKSPVGANSNDWSLKRDN